MSCGIAAPPNCGRPSLRAWLPRGANSCAARTSVHDAVRSLSTVEFPGFSGHLFPVYGEGGGSADARGQRDWLGYMLNSGWKAARTRAANRYQKEFGRESPMGFRRIRVHYGTRSGDACARPVLSSSRQDLFGHKSSRVTTHYSASEIGNLVDAANLVTDSRRSPARTVLRVIAGKSGA